LERRCWCLLSLVPGCRGAISDSESHGGQS
jgi:hypothetical protein